MRLLSDTAPRVDAALKDASSRGISARSVAHHLGIDPSTLSAWRNPKRPGNPNYEQAVQLCKFIGVPLRRVVGSSEPQPTDSYQDLWRQLTEVEEQFAEYRAKTRRNIIQVVEELGLDGEQAASVLERFSS